MGLDPIALTQEFVNVKSVSRWSNSAISDLVEHRMKECGLEVERLSYLDQNNEEKVSLVGKKGEGKGGLAFLSHTDTVPGQEQDWDAAHEYIRRLERVTGEDMSNVRAHYFCEKAQNSMDTGARPEAFRLLGEALNEDRKCVRARLLFADLSDFIGDNDTAIAHLKKIEHQDIDFLSEAIPRLVINYRKLDQLDELSDYLVRLSGLHLGITPVLVLAELTANRTGLDAAKNHIVAELKTRPTIRGIDRLIEYSMVDASGEYREDLQLLKETTTRLIEDKLSYRCGNCGFTGRSLHWQCPSCKSWSTVKPIHGIEGE